MKASEQRYYDAVYGSSRNPQTEWDRLLVQELGKSYCGGRIVDLGCGRANALRTLHQLGVVPEYALFGIDQSETAVDFVQTQLPQSHFSVGDIYNTQYPSEMFDVCLLLETIEHLSDPCPALLEVWRVLKPGGLLYVSFPNYLHLPWLFVRILSEMTRKHDWIGLQPIEKIYATFTVKAMLRDSGFEHVKTVGSHYGWPLLDKVEPAWFKRASTAFCNALGLHWLSFHPIMVFKKP